MYSTVIKIYTETHFYKSFKGSKMLKAIVLLFFYRCLHSHQLMPRLMYACQKYLKDDQLETPIGLITRLVLSNNIFIEQFCSSVKDLKVRTVLIINSILHILSCIRNQSHSSAYSRIFSIILDHLFATAWRFKRNF